MGSQTLSGDGELVNISNSNQMFQVYNFRGGEDDDLSRR